MGRSDCGVVAAFNAASWSKKTTTYALVERAARCSGYKKGRGIYGFQFVNLLNKLNIINKRSVNKNIEEIETEILLGKCFVILYHPKGHSYGHAITALRHRGRISILNPDSTHITWNEFASDCYAGGMESLVAFELPHRGTL